MRRNGGESSERKNVVHGKRGHRQALVTEFLNRNVGAKPIVFAPGNPSPPP